MNTHQQLPPPWLPEPDEEAWAMVAARVGWVVLLPWRACAGLWRSVGVKLAEHWASYAVTALLLLWSWLG